MFKNLEKYLVSENQLEKEFSEKLLNSQDIFYKILEMCDNKFDFGVGSYLFDGREYSYCEKMFQKQLLLYKIAKESKKVLEIGTYMGHSLLIMLLANPKIKITCIDIDSTYTNPSVKVLEKYFNTNINFLEGNSLDVLKSLNDKFDFFHIDGTHQIQFVKKEFDFCVKLTKSDVINVVFDDYNTVSEMGKLLNERYQILEYNIPNCEWNNAYYKIKI